MKEPSDSLAHTQRRARRPRTDQRLHRSKDRLIAGIAGGVAAYIDANPALVRWVVALAGVLTAGIFVVIYLLFWLILPAT